MSNTVDWVAAKIAQAGDLEIVDHIPEGFLVVRARGGVPVVAAVLGIKGVIRAQDVEPILASANKPEFILNVPSSTLWRGDAIQAIHDAPAAFGKLGELSKAAQLEDVSAYRNKEWLFFYNAIAQHGNVQEVVPVFDTVFEARRYRGDNLVIAMVEAYNMSAEDVRNARQRYQHFDIAVKTTSYGSITSTAVEAAKSFGAETLMFGELMQRLAR